MQKHKYSLPEHLNPETTNMRVSKEIRECLQLWVDSLNNGQYMNEGRLRGLIIQSARHTGKTSLCKYIVNKDYQVSKGIIHVKQTFNNTQFINNQKQKMLILDDIAIERFNETYCPKQLNQIKVIMASEGCGIKESWLNTQLSPNIPAVLLTNDAEFFLYLFSNPEFQRDMVFISLPKGQTLIDPQSDILVERSIQCASHLVDAQQYIEQKLINNQEPNNTVCNDDDSDDTVLQIHQTIRDNQDIYKKLITKKIMKLQIGQKQTRQNKINQQLKNKQTRDDSFETINNEYEEEEDSTFESGFY